MFGASSSAVHSPTVWASHSARAYSPVPYPEDHPVSSRERSSSPLFSLQETLKHNVLKSSMCQGNVSAIIALSRTFAEHQRAFESHFLQLHDRSFKSQRLMFRNDRDATSAVQPLASSFALQRALSAAVLRDIITVADMEFDVALDDVAFLDRIFDDLKRSMASYAASLRFLDASCFDRLYIGTVVERAEDLARQGLHSTQARQERDMLKATLKRLTQEFNEATVSSKNVDLCLVSLADRTRAAIQNNQALMHVYNPFLTQKKKQNTILSADFADKRRDINQLRDQLSKISSYVENDVCPALQEATSAIETGTKSLEKLMQKEKELDKQEQELQNHNTDFKKRQSELLRLRDKKAQDLQNMEHAIKAGIWKAIGEYMDASKGVEPMVKEFLGSSQTLLSELGRKDALEKEERILDEQIMECKKVIEHQCDYLNSFYG